MRHLLVLPRGVLVGVLVNAALVGCAKPRPVVPPPPKPVDVAPADALLESGCYNCLTEAFGIYERALAGTSPAPSTRDKAFVTAALLAVREKELGLEATPWLERARTFAAPDDQTYLDVATSMDWVTAGNATDFERPRPPGSPELDVWRAFLSDPAARHPVLAQYLLTAVVCLRGKGLDDEILGGLDTSRAPIRYRVGLCNTGRRRDLEAVFAADPRWVEAAFYIARYEMGNFMDRRWLVRAVPPMVAAHEGLPDAPVVTIGLAGLMRARGELKRALGLYDEALTLRPTQRDAMLGRVITLSYLGQHEEAIAGATRMIDLGTWHVGSAYYWRGWNHYQQRGLEMAAADVASARKLQVNADVMTLSGQVAYDQKRPKDARADFDHAINMDEDKCIAHWFLGILDLDEEAWPSASRTFTTSGVCFQRAADSLLAESKNLPPDLPDEAREQQLASYGDNVQISIRQAGRSFLNAAGAAVRAGNYTLAIERAESALNYEETKERAQTLLSSIKR